MTMPAQPKPASTVCPRCGDRVGADDHFCGNCGATLAVAHGPERADAPPPSPARRIVAVVGGCLLAAAVSGLVVALLAARRDLDTERERARAAQAQVADLTDQLAALEDPDTDLQQQLFDAQAQVEQLTAQVAQLTQDLATERDGRAADATAAQAAQTEAVAAVQTQLDAATVQLNALQTMFPMEEDAFRAAAPSGEYQVSIAQTECTIINCLELRTLTLSFPDATKVSGNRANGILSFADGSYAATGDLAGEQSPFCNGVETNASFLLVFHATTVTVSNGLLAATAMEGTYRETIDSGDCSGQYREYSVSMTK